MMAQLGLAHSSSTPAISPASRSPIPASPFRARPHRRVPTIAAAEVAAVVVADEVAAANVVPTHKLAVPLAVTVDPLSLPDCGLANGSVKINVTGGSGHYL